MAPENHILIAWENARIDTAAIIKEMPSHLEVKLMFLYIWKKEDANQNYAAFYGEKLENIQYKVDHCGSGSFRVLVIHDKHPRYAVRKTSRGERTVNTTMFDLKTRLREITGGGHLIHGSDTLREANVNAISLFGKPIEHVLGLYENEHKLIEIKRNITGVHGWKNWEELLTAMNYCTDYVILRNAETVVDNNHADHGDTDLLVEDYASAITILAGKKEAPGEDRVLYRVNIANDDQLIDVRYVSDDYYCEVWERKILQTRNPYGDSSYYVPDEENQKYSLLYHALVHKAYLSADYKRKLAVWYGDKDREELKEELDVFLRKEGYSVTLPKDKSVYVNPEYARDAQLPMMRKAVNIIKLHVYVGRSDDERETKCNKTVFKIFYRGYHLAITTLRRIKTRIGRARHS